MSDEEVDELLKAVDTSSGEINYTGIAEVFRAFLRFADPTFRSRPHDPGKLNTCMARARIAPRAQVELGNAQCQRTALLNS